MSSLYRLDYVDHAGATFAPVRDPLSPWTDAITRDRGRARSVGVAAAVDRGGIAAGVLVSRIDRAGVVRPSLTIDRAGRVRRPVAA